MTRWAYTQKARTLLHESAAARRRGENGEIVLTYVGANPENVSGWSAKFWMLIPPDHGTHVWLSRWGKLGTRGQRAVVRPRAGDMDETLVNKIASKLAKGYVASTRADIGGQPVDSRIPLEERIAIATWSAHPIEAIVALIARRSASKLHTVNGVQLWLAPDDTLIGTRAVSGTFQVCDLGRRR